MKLACRNSTILTTVTATIAILAVAAPSIELRAQESDGARPPASTRQAPAVSRDVYEKLEQSQVLIDSEAYDEALKLLTSLVAQGDLTDYERSNALRYLAHAHHAAGDTDAAIDAFAAVLDVPGLEDEMRTTTLFALAQLCASNEQYDDSLQYLDEWFLRNPEPRAEALILKAQVLYALARYEEMVEPIEQALNRAEASGVSPKEDWYALLNFARFQLEDYAGVRDVSKIMLANWPRKRYWLYLANAYRELGDDDRLIAAYDAAHLQGFLTSEAELVTLAQLYLQAEVPYAAAKLLESAMNDGRISDSPRNLRLLSQSWTLAQEDDRSIDPLQRAARLEDNGDLFARLANVFLGLDRYGECIDAANAAITKDQLTSPDYVQLSLGMCSYHAGAYQHALRAFHEAARVPRSARTAANWIEVTRNTMKRDEDIAAVEALTRQRQQELEARRQSDERG